MRRSGVRSSTRAKDGFLWHALRILGLSAVIFAQPLLDTVARSGEFLVAHRATNIDIFALVFVLLVLVPAAPIALAWLGGVAWYRLQQAVLSITIAALVACQALPLLKKAGLVATGPTAALAAVIAAAATASYWRFAVVRSFASVLALSMLVVPGAFLLSGPIARVWRPSEIVPPPAPAGVSIPIVMVVLDQLPLTSLLDQNSEIDARLYPSFAALARESTWFRSATAVADRTGAAVPAMLTAEYPPRDRLPRAEDYPNNLFTWLAPYDFHVYEPITALCPSNRCGRSLSSTAERLEAMLGDLTVVFQHIISPMELEAMLPPINQDWRDFDVPLWHRLWKQRRVEDRRASFVNFVREIERPGARPPLHFLHVLLPHEPFIYYASGLRFAIPREPLSGLTPGTEVWSKDPWLVAYSYQRHLQQVRMVDSLIGSLVERLRTLDLYDPALLVVVADHGASFRPGESFRTPATDNFADIMSVPVFVKAPYQRQGQIDDRPFETIDVLPTMADILKAKIPWAIDGDSGLGAPTRRRQRIYYGRASRRSISPRDVRRGRNEALRLKLDLFGSPPDPDRLTGLGAAGRVLGRRVESFSRIEPGRSDVFLELRSRQLFEAERDFLPGVIAGYMPAEIARESPPQLALAVDGTIQAIARPDSAALGRMARWAALVPEQAQRQARRIEIFEIVPGGRTGPGLRRTGAVADRGGTVNLLNRNVQAQLEIQESGFYDEEYAAGASFRWTKGEATLSFRLDPERPPKALAISLVHGGPDGRTLQIHVGDCSVYRGPAPTVPSRHEFPLQGCQIPGTRATIRLKADVLVPDDGDQRELGLALEYVAIRY